MKYQNNTISKPRRTRPEYRTHTGPPAQAEKPFVRNPHCVRDVRFPAMAFCAREGMESVCAHE